jgi:hypothetical protein
VTKTSSGRWSKRAFYAVETGLSERRRSARRGA